MSFAITPEMVKEAYQKTGLKPIQHNWAEIDCDGNKCVCGLAAVAALKNGWSFVERVSKTKEIADLLSITPEEAVTFQQGFDRKMYLDTYDLRIFEAGQAAAEAVGL